MPRGVHAKLAAIDRERVIGFYPLVTGFHSNAAIIQDKRIGLYAVVGRLQAQFPAGNADSCVAVDAVIDISLNAERAAALNTQITFCLNDRAGMFIDRHKGGRFPGTDQIFAALRRKNGQAFRLRNFDRGPAQGNQTGIFKAQRHLSRTVHPYPGVGTAAGNSVLPRCFQNDLPAAQADAERIFLPCAGRQSCVLCFSAAALVLEGTAGQCKEKQGAKQYQFNSFHQHLSVPAACLTNFSCKFPIILYYIILFFFFQGIKR